MGIRVMAVFASMGTTLAEYGETQSGSVNDGLAHDPGYSNSIKIFQVLT